MRGLKLSTLFGLLLFTSYAMASHEKTTYGYIEKVVLVEKDLTLSAKLDTGAKTASLNATNITEIEVNNKPYLQFIVPSKAGDMVFQCEYIGKVHIKVRAGEARVARLIKRSIKRPVVLMKIRLGSQEQMIRVNLTNRKRFIYPLLLGRDAINAFHGLIDSELKFTIKTKSIKKATHEIQ
jgi:hypothetical protein